MALKLVPKFNREQIKKALQERSKRIEEAILLRLQRIGEQFVTNARNKADFTDRTGNLRSSIGYVILKDGQQLEENFEQRAGGPLGQEEAKKVIAESKKNFPTGYVLIGVAGMEYAAAVESKGYDVITSSAGIAESSLKLAVQKIQSQLK
jgi:hypothetical protein